MQCLLKSGPLTALVKLLTSLILPAVFKKKLDLVKPYWVWSWSEPINQLPSCFKSCFSTGWDWLIACGVEPVLKGRLVKLFTSTINVAALSPPTHISGIKQTRIPLVGRWRKKPTILQLGEQYQGYYLSVCSCVPIGFTNRKWSLPTEFWGLWESHSILWFVVEEKGDSHSCQTIVYSTGESASFHPFLVIDDMTFWVW